MDEHRDGDSDSDVEPEPGPSTSHHHLSSSSRQMRNEAEKKRRDTLNGYITELGRLVPTVDSTPRRIDKISILRLAATYLMQNQILHKETPQDQPFLPSGLHQYNLSLSMVEDMDAFMLVVTSAGKIVFVSHTVEKILGHAQIDMFGQSLFNFTIKEDHPVLMYNLQPDGESDRESTQEGDADTGSGDDTSCSSESSLSPPPACTSTSVGAPHECQRRSFYIQLSQRCVSRSELPEYKRVHLFGNLRVPQNRTTNRRPRRHTGDWLGGDSSVTNESVLVAIVKVESRIEELSIKQANRDEYITRHFIDGRISYSDHRIATVAGYLAEEVCGMSAFKFMHQDDVIYAIVCLRQMYDFGGSLGHSCYRLQVKTGQYIYLQTHGYLEKDEETGMVSSLICVNTLMREEDGIKLTEEMKLRFSAHVEATLSSVSRIGDGDVELEQVISQLMAPTSDKAVLNNPLPDPQHLKAVMCSKSLPPFSVQASKQLAILKSSELSVGGAGTSTSRPGSPGSNGHIAHTERPSVITSGLRRRRHDSDTPAAAKRRCSPQQEELVIQGPPQMSPEEQSNAILNRGQTLHRTGGGDKQGLYSPRVKTRRYTQSPDLALQTTPIHFLSTDTGDDPLASSYHSARIRDYPQNLSDVELDKEDLLSPNQSTFSNPDAVLSPSQTSFGNLSNISTSSSNCPFTVGSFQSPNQNPNVNTTDTLLSPGQSTLANTEDLQSPSQTLHSSQSVRTNRDSSQAMYSKRHLRSNSSQVLFTNQDKTVPVSTEDPVGCSQDISCPVSVSYSGKSISNSNQASFHNQVVLTPETVDESLYSLDVRSSDTRQYLIDSMLSHSDLILPEMEQVQVPTPDNPDSDTPLFMIVEHSHSQLESNLQIQQMQITSIKQDIKQVPKSHSDQVFKNFTELEDEHKQNQHLLHILKQDVSRTCP